MNIFVLDEDIPIAAKYHCDKHVVKMIIEYAQMLSTAQHELGLHSSIRPDDIYKPTHKNHPAAKWARECSENYFWLWKLGVNLCVEYTERYGKIHKTQGVLKRLAFHPNNISHKGNLTPFWSPKGYEYGESLNIKTAIDAYRQYYINEKFDICTWKNSQTPYWFPNKLMKGL